MQGPCTDSQGLFSLCHKHGCGALGKSGNVVLASQGLWALLAWLVADGTQVLQPHSLGEERLTEHLY